MTTSEKYIKTPEMAQPVMEDKIENSTECFKCKQATFYPVKCARCVEWRKRHSAPFLMPFRDVFKKTKATTTEPLCVNCISQDDYYGNICAECQDYLSAIAWNEPPPSPFPTECANCKNPTIYPAECERCVDGHGDPEPLCEVCSFQDDYYGAVCGACHGYLLDNQ